MILETKPLHEITSEAMELLFRELGPVAAVRFLSQFHSGFGDYTQEREQLFAGLTLDQVLGGPTGVRAGSG